MYRSGDIEGSPQRFGTVCYNNTGSGGRSETEPYDQGDRSGIVTRTYSCLQSPSF